LNTATLNNLKALRLSGVINSLELRIEEAIKNKLSYLEFFELVIQDEVINRTNRSNQNRLLKAKFKQHKTIEEFNFSYQPSINRQEIYALATCEFIRKKENIAFIGPPGTGKSHIATAIGVKAAHQGYSVLFATVNQMLEDLYISRADNSFNQKLKKYLFPELLILDELGLRKLNQNSVDDLYEVIAGRYEQKSTIITSNKTFDQWGRVLFDPVLATAILDRFIHHCHFVMIKGESYRMRDRQGLIDKEQEPKAVKRGRPPKIKDDALMGGDQQL
jgi:DNA replication protein DnaC